MAQALWTLEGRKLAVSTRMVTSVLCVVLSVNAAGDSGVTFGVSDAPFDVGRTFRVTRNDASYVNDGNSRAETSGAANAFSHANTVPLPSLLGQNPQMDRPSVGREGHANILSKLRLDVESPSLLDCLSPVTMFSLIVNVLLILVWLVTTFFRPLETACNGIKPKLPKHEEHAHLFKHVVHNDDDEFLLRRVERLASSCLPITVLKSPSTGQSWLRKHQRRFLVVLPRVDIRGDGSATSRLAEWRTGFLGWWEAKSDYSNWCRNGKPAPKGSIRTLDIDDFVLVSDVEVSLTHRADAGTKVMLIKFEDAAECKPWVSALRSLLKLLSPSPPQDVEQQLASLAESGFDDRGDSTLVMADSYAYTLANGLHCELTGWTHTKTYAKGFVSIGPHAPQAVVSDLMPGATYAYNVYQLATDFADDTALLSVNGGPGISVTSSTSEEPSATGTAVASVDGRITFVFTPQGKQVHLSGLALARKPVELRAEVGDLPGNFPQRCG
eukprot:TRINITY_DN7329_c0_g1_i1.p1 TRINITY_DN7329_c0_g1~~TRINITY_DN7329_c0_g1_i1.p1  ORF type:complete len:497 (-),score=79.88 TRINITY_DN7329_c0_g1_i1:51-1541(-)